MRKLLKLIYVSTVFVLIGAGIMVWPMFVIAHGWKAPSDAAQRANPIRNNESSIQQGRQIYGDLCIGCHGVGGKGNGPIANNLNPQPANLVKRLKNHSEGDFFWKISKGRGPMPGFKDQLSERQIWQVINYIKSLSGK